MHRAVRTGGRSGWVQHAGAGAHLANVRPIHLHDNGGMVEIPSLYTRILHCVMSMPTPSMLGLPAAPDQQHPFKKTYSSRRTACSSRRENNLRPAREKSDTDWFLMVECDEICFSARIRYRPFACKWHEWAPHQLLATAQAASLVSMSPERTRNAIQMAKTAKYFSLSCHVGGAQCRSLVQIYQARS